MADSKKSGFEEKVSRLEAIVKELEGGSVELDRAVALFKEGRALATECEQLLKGTQQQIDRAMESQTQPEARTSEDEIPF
ncbi:MAG TPA: exodeoxyribonuclease VII small subunit [Candidatus Rubrimentiphilum sp.]|nr:exodeoxyribonuclease VII small subunit [Candidatus Rubrimentiphilum sp.]